jgi:hypothetical protein
MPVALMTIMENSCGTQLTMINSDSLRCLLSCLDAPDPKVVAIAVHDLGEYLKHYPNGKR